MGASSTTIGDLKNLPPGQDVVLPQAAPDLDARVAAQQDERGTSRTDTLYVLIFRGHPRDSIRERKAELFIVGADVTKTNLTYRLEGQRGAYCLNVATDPVPPYSRPYYLRNYHVATVPARAATDVTLHDLVVGTPIHNDDPEWSRFSWIQDVLNRLSTAGIISTEEGDEVLDQTVNVIFDAPYPETDD